MDKDISNSVRGFFDRYPYAATLGRLTNQTEIEGLPKEMKDAIPEWYKNLLLEFPIANLPLGIPNDFGQSLLKNKSFESLPLMGIIFHSVDKISELTNSRFPYNLLLRKQFIGIAEDQDSTGEGIFI